MSCGADRGVVGWKEARREAQVEAWKRGAIPTGWPRPYRPQARPFPHGLTTPVKCSAGEAARRQAEQRKAKADLVSWTAARKALEARIGHKLRKAEREEFEIEHPKPEGVGHPRLAEIPVEDYGDPDLRWFLTGPQAGKVIVNFSGGKDSLALLLYVMEVCAAAGLDPREHVEAWHQSVDGRPEHLEGESSQSVGRGSDYHQAKWDWPVTESYCRAVCECLGIQLFFGWREGGLQGTVLKGEDRARARAPAAFELPGQIEETAGGKSQDHGVRMSYPMTGADLRTRWCSAEVKIDVGKSQLSAREDLFGKRILYCTGERAEESANRATYAEREFFGEFKAGRIYGKHGADGRHVERWRPLLDWCELDVWAQIRRWGIRPHPAYRIGFGRLSCMTCIFGNAQQWATVKKLDPTRYEQFVATEDALLRRQKKDVAAGVPGAQKRLTTVKRGTPKTRTPLPVVIAGAKPYKGDYSVAPLAMSTHYPISMVRVDPRSWKLPAGAFREGAGPT